MTKNFGATTVTVAPGQPTTGTALGIPSGHGTRLATGPATIRPATGQPSPTTCEVVTVTAITPGASVDTLTVVRAVEGSTARTITVGDIVEQGITAATWDALVDEAAAAGTAAAQAATDAAQASADATAVASALSTTAAAVTTLQGTVAGLSSTTSGMQATVTGLSSAVTALQSTVTGLQSTVAGHTTSLTSLTTTVTGLATTVAALAARGVISTDEGQALTAGSDGLPYYTTTPAPAAPTTASDGFDRADGALGTGWTGHTEAAPTITSQTAAGTQGSGICGAYRTEVYGADQWAQVQITATALASGQWFGPSVRVSANGQTGYLAIYFNNGGTYQIVLYKRVAGSFTSIGSYASGQLTAGAVLKVAAVGTSVTVLVGNVPRITVTDTAVTTGQPGIMFFGVGRLDQFACSDITTVDVQLQGTDANGVQTWTALSAANGPGPTTLRVLAPTSPAAGKPRRFLWMLPVEAGTASSFGDPVDTARLAGIPNAYNAVVIAPTYAIESWGADSPSSTWNRHETFTGWLRTWAKGTLTTQGGGEPHWLIGFSKSGMAAQGYALKHPSLWARVATWDFPADMTAYDQYYSSSATAYGTDANFQTGYRLTSAFVAARKSPYTAATRMWIGGYQAFQQDMTDYHALLAGLGVLHVSDTPTLRAHRWDSGWVPVAVSALDGMG